MTPDPESQPRPDLYEPPRPEDRRPNPRGRPTAEEIEAYVREVERRLGIGTAGSVAKPTDTREEST